MNKYLTTIISVLTIFGIIFGAYLYIDNRYALSEELNKVNQRLDYKIKSDQLNAVQQRIWNFDDRYQKKGMDNVTTNEYRALQQQKDELNKELTNIGAVK